MTGLSTYLWKEWRDQRVEIIGYAMLVPILMAIAIVAIPGAWARADALPTFIALGGLVIGALTLASDLVPGELRRGHLGFLARLPGDLRAAFVAKLLFCVLGLAAFCLYAWLCTTALSAMLAGGKWFTPLDWTWRLNTARYHGPALCSLLDVAIVLCAWIFAVSCWLPRGTLTLPAAAIVLAVIGGPTAVTLLCHRGIELHGEEMTALRLWLPASALLTAALSFLRGLRHGRRPARIAGWALGGTLFAAAPVWGWTANRLHDYVTLDFRSGDFALEPVVLGEGGRFLFANVQPRVERAGGRIEDEAMHAMVVDLDQGSLRAASGADSLFALPAATFAGLAPSPLVLLYEAVGDAPLRHPDRGAAEWSAIFDGRRGSALTGAECKELLRDAGAIERRVVGARDAIVLRDGTRCWRSGRILHVAAREGREEAIELEGAPREVWYWQPCGAGFRVLSANGVGYVDATTRKFVSAAALEPVLRRTLDGATVRVGAQGGVLSIGPEAWLLHVARTQLPAHARVEDFAFAVWRSGEATAREFPAIDPADSVVAAAADGRVVVVTGALVEGRKRRHLSLAWVDPGNGTRMPIPLSPDLAQPSWTEFEGALPSGALLVRLQWRDSQGFASRLVRLARDGTVGVTAVLPSIERTIGCPDESTVVVQIDADRIVRAKFDGSPYELLFPRDEARR